MHLCSAVQYLHRHGILHLDLKPSNVISDLGQAKLLDLSIARPPERARPGVGTQRYMAPEQAHGGEIGPHTDVWGIGAVLFEAAVGAPPFGQDGVGGLNGSAGSSVSRSVRRHRRLPGELARAIDGCLEMHPANRPDVNVLSRQLDRSVEKRLGGHD